MPADALPVHDHAPPRARITLVGALAVFALALVAFWPATANGFVTFDDARYVSANDVVRGGLSWGAVRWAFTTLYFANYHPLTWLSHCLDVTLFGLAPAGHHLTSVLWHALASALFVPALTACTGRPVVGVVVGALFAVHPQHVESVAWIAERKDVLSAVAFAATLWAWGAAHRTGHARLKHIALVAFAAGLLAKPMLVTMPAVLLVVDLVLLRRPPDARLFLEKLPFAVLGVAAALGAIIAQGREGAVVGEHWWPASMRISNAFVSLMRYVIQTVWPAHLSPYYTAPAGGWSLAVTATSMVAVVVITGAVVVLALRRWSSPAVWSAPLAGWLWFCGMLLPVIGFLKIGLQAMADRYTYLPHVGLFLIVGTAIDHGWRTPRLRTPLALAGTLAVTALLWRTHIQIGVWQGPTTLWNQAVAVEPDSVWANYFAIDPALADGDIDTAIARARIAARGAPESVDVLERLGRVLVMANDFAGAEAPLHKIIASDPERDVALLLLAEAYRQTSREAEARTLFARAADAARRNGHPDIAARARIALSGGPLTDLSDPAPPPARGPVPHGPAP